MSEGKQMKQMRANVLLFITAFIWGNAFVAQSVGMDYVGAYTFLATRSIIGGIFLIPCMKFIKKLDENTAIKNKETRNTEKKIMILGGTFCGVILFIASAFQQIGIKYTSVGKSGFITALYIIIVPIMSIFLKKKVKNKIWISVVLTLFGLYLLCIKENAAINKGDILMLLCAIFFSLHILVVDYFSPKVDGVKMSCIQFFVCGIISTIAMFIFEEPNIGSVFEAYKPILYAGILSSGVGYTFQIIAQKDSEPTVASLIMSLESVFAVLGGWILLKQELTIKEISGCILILFAIIIAQIPKSIDNNMKK